MKITNEIRSEIMTKAWKMYKKSWKSFSYCLRFTWSKVKKELNKFKVNSENTIKETAKAVLCKVSVSFNCWIPKSQISGNGDISEWFYNQEVKGIYESNI